MMREIGYSDKVFQNKNAKSVSFQFVLTEEPKPDTLKLATKKALVHFPEYAVAPVKKDGKLYYEENNREIAVYPVDAIERYLGTVDTNYFLFYMRYGKNSVEFIYFHGLTDFRGIWAFIRTILYYYAITLGHSVSDISESDPEMDEEERYNPYKKHQNRYAKEVLLESKNAVFHVQEDSIPDKLHQYDISTSYDDYMTMTHRWGASAATTMVAVLSNAIAEQYDIGDRDVAIKLTVDMRPFFASPTRVNFSRSLLLVNSSNDRELPLPQQAVKLKSMMKRQMTTENFSRYIAGVVAKVRAIFGEIDTPDVTMKKNERTCTLSYLGQLDFPEEYDCIIKDLTVRAYVDSDSVRFTAWAIGGKLHLAIHQTFDSDAFASKIAEIFARFGLELEIRNLECYGNDRYDVDRIKEIRSYGYADKRESHL